MSDLEIVFTTRGFDALATRLDDISKRFAALDTSSKGKGLGPAAVAIDSAATHLDQASARLLIAAAKLRGIRGAGGRGTRGGGMMDALGISAGGIQIKQIVTKVIEMLGPEAVAIAAVTATVFAAGVALEQLAAHAAELGVTFTRLQNTLGSSGTTTARVRALGAAVGLSPDAMGSTAAAIQGRITSDPMAAAFAARMGVRNISGPFGDPDWGKQMLRIVDGLRAITNREQRVIAARELGAENLLPAAEVSDKQWAKNKADVGTTSDIFDSKFAQDAADFTAAFGRVTAAFENLIAAGGKGLLPVITDWLNEFADWLESTAEWVNRNASTMETGARVLESLVKFAFGDYAGGVKAAMDARDAASAAQNAALDNNTDAIQNNTNATMQLNGTFGRSARAQMAVPAGMSGEYLSRALSMGGMNLGWF